MTQPPQPPNEPPQGGFGAPQDPPPGGFGAQTPPPSDGFAKQPPQAPQAPAPGGYGAPQAPAPGGYGAPQPPQPGVPPQNPGYGYPQAPPPGAPPAQAGYGFPQGPPPGQPGMPPQQAYGYPTAPMQPQYPGQPAGNTKKFSTQMQIIVAAAAAVVLIIGGGVVYSATSGGEESGKKPEAASAGTTGGESKGGEGGGLAGGDEKAPASTKSAVGFQLPQPKVTDTTTVAGSWLTDKVYVKTGVYEIVGYDTAKGTKLWSIPLAGQVCSASKHMSKDFKTAIVFEAGKRSKAEKYQPCNQVGALDLATGKLLWSKSVTASTGGDEPLRYDEVTVSGSTVAAGGTSGGAAFNLTTGAELWKPTADADGCYDMGYGGGEALATVRKCGTYDNPQLTVQALNPTTGAPISSYKMPAGVEYASIVSTKPLVVAADVGDTAGDGSGISDFFSIDAATGKLLVRISADADKYAARCGSTEVETCQHLAVGNNRLYVPTEEHEGGGEYGDTNEIVAFDLTTGKLVGGKADAGDRYTLTPLRMDGTNVIAYKQPPYDKGGQIVSIDGGTFKETLLMENPADEAVRDAESSFSGDYSEVIYSKGQLFLSETMISEPRESSLDDKEYLVISFRTS